jgi:glycosyltransferase involved in cell wall biosynthesis
LSIYKPMTRILLVGYHPPPLMGEAKIEAAHYRTWQFLQPLLDDGHQVCLCAGAPGEAQPAFTMPPAWQDQLEYQYIPYRQSGWMQTLQQAHDSFNPDCIVAINFSHCLYATRLRTDKPIWMDIYGDILTILQAAVYRAQSDRGLATTIGFMRQVLQRGDIFSGCGRPQQHMTVGELAMIGRLNRQTFGYEFTRVILPGSPPVSELAGREPKVKGGNGRSWLDQFDIPTDAFVVLWCGGYNTWTDVDTLFAALEQAMAADEKVHYLSVGASTYTGPDNVYDHFLKLIENSPYRARFHMLGWRPWSEMGSFYRSSDVGLNIDALHYETLYGTRTRLVEMIAADLPVITSVGPELSYLLRDAGAALTFPVGDANGLGQHVLTLSHDTACRDQMAAAAGRYAAQNLSFYETTAPLRHWVTNPVLAPDRQTASPAETRRRWRHQLRAWLRLILWRLTGHDK